MPRLKRIKDGDLPLPWERQPEESEEAWAAFVTYRDMLQLGDDGTVTGRRSIRQVARRVDKSATLIARWASPKRHKWSLRVEAYDADLDRDRRAVLRTQAINAVQQHARVAERIVDAICLPLDALFKPRRVVDAKGAAVLNGDGDEIYVDRGIDLEAALTAELVLLLKTIGMLLPTVIEIRMQALGNPNEPLPELPEWGEGGDEEERADRVPVDRMLELIRAADEAGLIDASTLATAEQLALEAGEDAAATDAQAVSAALSGATSET